MVCNRVCLGASVAVLSRNTTRLVPSRQYSLPFGSWWRIAHYHCYSEGPHAKYHYMICGVQGDFTRSLVNDPPKYLWTRELKVTSIPFLPPIPFQYTNCVRSLPVSHTRRPSTSAEFAFVPAPALVQLSRPASSLHTGTYNSHRTAHI